MQDYCTLVPSGGTRDTIQVYMTKIMLIFLVLQSLHDIKKSDDCGHLKRVMLWTLSHFNTDTMARKCMGCRVKCVVVGRGCWNST